MEDAEHHDDPAIDWRVVLLPICRSPRNDGSLDAALLTLLIEADPALARTDTEGAVWLPRHPATLAERLGSGRKQVEQSVARLLGHGFVRSGVDEEGTGWIAPVPAAISEALDALEPDALEPDPPEPE